MNYSTLPLRRVLALLLLVLPILALLAPTPAAAQIALPPVYMTLPYMQPPGASSYSCVRTYNGENACRITSGPLVGWSGLTVADPNTGGTKGVVLGPQGQKLICLFIPNGIGGMIPLCRPTQPIVSRTPEPSFPTNQQPAQTEPPAGTESGAVTNVRLTREVNSWTLPVTLNGTTTHTFVLDTGADTVRLPMSIAAELIRNGSLAQDDLHPIGSTILANGSSVPTQGFLLRSITVGGVTVRNVPCSVDSGGGDALLGGSFLQNFKIVKIDYQRGVLTLGDPVGPVTLASLPASMSSQDRERAETYCSAIFAPSGDPGMRAVFLTYDRCVAERMSDFARMRNP
jgi:hypothetical protein